MKERFDDRITRIFNKAVDVFGSPQIALDWMHERLLALDNRTPLEFCNTEEGAQEVEQLLGRIEHGIFS